MDADIKDLIERVEQRIEGYIQQTNNKLDLLITLMERVATIQATQAHHSEELDSLKRRLDNNDASQLVAITRVHERIDLLQTDTRGSFHKATQSMIDQEHRIIEARDAKLRDVESSIRQLREAMSSCGDECGDGQQGLKDKVSEVDAKYDRKLHYVRGVLAAIAAIALLVPTIAAKYYGELVDSIKSIQVLQEKHGVQIGETDRRVDSIKVKQ